MTTASFDRKKNFKDYMTQSTQQA